MAIFKCAGRRRLDDDGNPRCEYEHTRPWKGRCPGCGRYYNCEKVGTEAASTKKRFTAGDSADIVVEYLPTEVPMFDRVLSGGLVKGSTVVFGGVHGGGKSSLLTMVCDGATKKHKRKALYASSEQSIMKVLEIFKRLDIKNIEIEVMSAKCVRDAIQRSEEISAFVTIYDSLQNFRLEEDSGMPSARESNDVAGVIAESTQRRSVCSIIVNQLNDDLGFKGGTSVPHLIDTELMLYKFDMDQDKQQVKALLGDEMRLAIKKGDVEAARLRLLRCGKNRNGEENISAFFEMTRDGQLRELKPRSSLEM